MRGQSAYDHRDPVASLECPNGVHWVLRFSPTRQGAGGRGEGGGGEEAVTCAQVLLGTFTIQYGPPNKTHT